MVRIACTVIQIFTKLKLQCLLQELILQGHEKVNLYNNAWNE